MLKNSLKNFGDEEYERFGGCVNPRPKLAHFFENDEYYILVVEFLHIKIYRWYPSDIVSLRWEFNFQAISELEEFLRSETLLENVSNFKEYPIKEGRPYG